MSEKFKNIFYKFLYGAAFTLFLPLLLILWAKNTEAIVLLPLPAAPLWGAIVACLGILLMLTGMLGLLVHGKGLPMNAFPPPQYVQRGIYHIFPHPIYVGFSFCCFGCAVFCQSASGFWLVAPIASLAGVALVLGFEKQELAERFGAAIQKPLIALPADEERKPSPAERISVFLLVLLPWVIVYELVVLLGTPPDAIDAFLSFERTFPVLEHAEIMYGATYLLVIMFPLIARHSRELREFSLAGIVATIGVPLIFVGIPFVAHPHEFVPTNIFGQILLFERGYDSAAAAFPSFHVIWAFIAARGYAKSFPSLKAIWWLTALAICASCILTGMHALVDVLAGGIIGVLCIEYKRVWEWLRSASEYVANSWKEWRFGSLRIINHGIYTGLGAGLAVLIAGTLLGASSVGYVFLIAFSSLVGAGIWAQVVEGSSSLLRPFGYYGGVIGIFAGLFLSAALGGDFWLLSGAFAVCGPLTQALGRLRCLVQGCCHGRKTTPHIGIRYTHPRSRVCRLSDLGNIPVHPTQLYSILWNIANGILLARLWSLGASPALISGLYLVLNGLGRFVEEAFRGEPQTAILGKLRLYQLLAIVSVIGGAVVTTLPCTLAIPTGEFNLPVAGAALLFFFFTWFAQGMDFPDSFKRFARLT
jgi:prolipoprotein diacylglyceryltransferase/membrane-associated phospholipid phosphatase